MKLRLKLIALALIVPTLVTIVVGLALFLFLLLAGFTIVWLIFKGLYDALPFRSRIFANIEDTVLKILQESPEGSESFRPLVTAALKRSGETVSRFSVIFKLELMNSEGIIERSFGTMTIKRGNGPDVQLPALIYSITELGNRHGSIEVKPQ